MSEQRPLPSDRSPVYVPYFDGLRNGRIVVQQCTHCDSHVWPPAEMCGKCQHEDFRHVEMPQVGEVYTFTVSYRAFHPAFQSLTPHPIATVDLGNDVLILGEYGGDPEALSVGDRVHASFFEAGPDSSLIRWMPDNEQAASNGGQ
jgi:uncharacterized protein